MRGLFGSAARLLVFVGLLACLSDGLAAPPNLLVIVADDLGTDSLELYEGLNDHTDLAPSPDSPYRPLFDGKVRYPRTPTIDELARRGLLLTRAWSAPTCTPTRTTILAGRHPRAALTGVSALHRTPIALSPHEWTIPEVLDVVTQGRYATAVIGKWHLGSCTAGGLDAPRVQAGFDYFAGTLKNLTGSMLEKGDAACRAGPCAQHCQACQASGYLRWCRIESTSAGTRSSLLPVASCGEGCRPPDYPASRKVDDAAAWIERQTQPWFLYLAFHLPHGQFHVPPFALLSEATVRRMKERGWPELAMSRTVCPQADETDLIRCRRDMYLAMIEAMDTEIGRLLRTLT
jgi:arylsulfatase A-like enzyme